MYDTGVSLSLTEALEGKIKRSYLCDRRCSAEEEGMGYGGVKVTTDVIRNLVTWQVIPFSRPLLSHATASHVLCHMFPNTAPFGTTVTSLKSGNSILSPSMESMRR